MMKQWDQFAEKINALSLRERGILFALLSVGLLLIANSLIIEPQLLKHKLLSDGIKREQAQIAALQAEISQRAAGVLVDPNADVKRRLASTRKQIEELDQSLLAVHKNLVRPEKMADLLESILRRNRKLQLVSLKTMPVLNLAEPSDSSANGRGADGGAGASTKHKAKSNDQGAEGVADAALYKHEVEIVVEGSYLDMLATLQELEALPEQVYWHSVTLSVLEYPTASLSMRVFTLSLDKKWLNL
ncbi:MAG: MSHA biogenesis protein MshJ [Burkholderiaceae bacterium]|nr:MSHA biogenesis protein MshJ [Burkholderiaceae bacterium]